ncbi:glycoside hydrolase family 3 N-terminal domain-containing protein [Corynebacterium sp. HS2168-gen11]|uniref:glycoside hydrolase family 3 N-terminal domain-containing protein n=1 Tax=Corynebacterium sp. HS2168-gen11 TaxID=2974027 RepID=UPI0037BEC18C
MAALGACSIALVGCAHIEAPVETSSVPIPPTTISTLVTTTSASPSTAQALQPAEHELRQRIATTMMVGVRNYDDAVYALERGAGGIFIGSDTDPALLTTPGRDIAALRAQIQRPFAVSIDFEGGRVLRFPEIFGEFPAPRLMAAQHTVAQVRDLARQMGENLARRGITVNFAPVVDLDGGDLEVVGDRAFSTDPTITIAYATAFAQGMQDAGVTPVFKHFPGHGRASGDSHLGGVTTLPLAELQRHDMLPYMQVLQLPDVAVMVGHLVVPGWEDAQGVNVPATVNPRAYAALRRIPAQSGFQGVIYTDDLSGMKAITEHFSVPEAVARALEAGADQALWLSTADLDAAIDTVVAMVHRDEMTVEEIDAKVRRIANTQQ